MNEEKTSWRNNQFQDPHIEYFCNEDGMILGDVRPDADSLYRVILENKMLGKFITLKEAKSYLEKMYRIGISK